MTRDLETRQAEFTFRQKSRKIQPGRARRTHVAMVTNAWSSISNEAHFLVVKRGSGKCLLSIDFKKYFSIATKKTYFPSF